MFHASTERLHKYHTCYLLHKLLIFNETLQNKIHIKKQTN